ncbi:hypothetical protein LG302_15370 [Halomonas organivorans]
MRIVPFPIRGLCCGLLLAGGAALAGSPDTLTPGISDTYLIPQGMQRFVLEIDAAGQLRLEGRTLAAASSGMFRLQARLLDPDGRLVADTDNAYGVFRLQAPVVPGRYRLEVDGQVNGSRRQLETSRYSILTVLDRARRQNDEPR